MSREIKFRAWDSSLNRMFQIQLDDNHWDITALNTEDDWHVMQYTGLKDKNGTEIYEGDILCHKVVPPGFVEFADGSFVFNQGETNQGLSQLCMDRTKRLGIIGNIYENPELLENDHE